MRTLPLVGDPLAHAEDSAATASKSRPTPDASGGPSFKLSRTSGQRSNRTGRPARSRCTAAARQGSAIAVFRPGAGPAQEVGEALERRKVAAEELRAPERPIRPVAGAVEDEREPGTLLAVLGEAGGGVRVMVLDADGFGVLLECPLGRQVLGVEVVGDDLGLDPEHLEVEFEIATEGAVRGLRDKVAQMG